MANRSLIMVGQNLQTRHREARAEEEFKTVEKMFTDMETVMKHLDAQDRELIRQSGPLTALVESTVPAGRRAAILAEHGVDSNGGGAAASSGSAKPRPQDYGGCAR